MSFSGDPAAPGSPFAVSVDTTCITVRPSEFPNCAAVLKTAPASDCVSSGKTLETTMSPTVKRTSPLRGVRIWAKNALYQYCSH